MLRLKDMVISSIVVGLLACSGGEETQLLNRFFMACRSGDNATVASVSQVSFPAEGCEAWEVLEVSEGTTEPYRIKDLREQVDTAKKERDVQFEKGKYFLEDNYNDIEKIQLRLDKEPDHKFTGKVGEVQAEWEKIMTDRKALERNVQNLNRELEKESKLANMSIMGDAPINNLEGNVLKKQVNVTVTTEGQVKPYVFTMMKFDLTNPETNIAAKSRWIIVAIEETT